MLAYHGRPELKTELLARIEFHRQHDQLKQSFGYWDGERGCGVGCLAHASSKAHAVLERDFGFPERIGHLVDAMFEGLPRAEAILLPSRLVNAIQVGADLSLVRHQFAHWLLTDSGLLTITDINREAIAAVAELHRRATVGAPDSAIERSLQERIAKTRAAIANAEATP